MTMIAWSTIVYFAVVAIIGYRASRRTHTAADFFVAGRRIGLFTLAMSAMAATLSGFAFIGGPGLIYQVGLGAVFIVLPASLTNTMGAWVLARRMRMLSQVRELITVPDAIGVRFQSPAAQGLAAIAILLAVVGYMATNLLALGVVLKTILDVGPGVAIWMGAMVVLAYSASGGILAGVYNDVFQGVLMALASTLVFFFALESGGGLSAISRSIMEFDPGFLGPWGHMSPLAALSFFFVFGIGALGQPHVAHKYYMLRDIRSLRWYPLLMTFALSLTLLLFVGVGIAMKALVLQGRVPALTSPDDATPAFILGFTPLPLAALVFPAVVAAIMSTVNSFMSIGAAALTHDLPRAFGRSTGNELRRGRLWTVVLTLLAALLAQFSGTLVVFLGIFGWGLFASTLVPALAIGLNWTGATRSAAIASIGTGLISTLTLESLAYFKVFSFPEGVTATAIALVLSLLVFFVVSWFTRASARENLPHDVRLVMEA